MRKGAGDAKRNDAPRHTVKSQSFAMRPWLLGHCVEVSNACGPEFDQLIQLDPGLHKVILWRHNADHNHLQDLLETATM